MPTYVDDQKYIWGICLDILSDTKLLLNVFWPCKEAHGLVFAWSVLPWSLALRETCSSSWHQRHGLFFMWSSSTDARVDETLVVSRTRRRTYEMAPCGTPVILDISLWESTRSENRAIVSMITDRILLVSMIATLFWDGTLYTATAHNGKRSSAHKRLTGTGKGDSPLQWRHNERDCVSNHQRLDCLLKRLFRRRSEKT